MIENQTTSDDLPVDLPASERRMLFEFLDISSHDETRSQALESALMSSLTLALRSRNTFN